MKACGNQSFRGSLHQSQKVTHFTLNYDQQIFCQGNPVAARKASNENIKQTEKKKLRVRKWKRIGEGVFLKLLQMSFINRDFMNTFDNIHGKASQYYAKL